MREVTRLTCGGKLKEAMALLKDEKIQGRDGSDQAERKGAETSDPAIIDIVAPSGPEQVWTVAGESSAAESVEAPRSFLARAIQFSPIPLHRAGDAHQTAEIHPAGARFLECKFSNSVGTRSYKLYCHNFEMSTGPTDLIKIPDTIINNLINTACYAA